jgi:hypothetical protein
MVGHAAGTAAALAWKARVAVQEVDLASLHAALLAENMILEVAPGSATESGSANGQ